MAEPDDTTQETPVTTEVPEAVEPTSDSVEAPVKEPDTQEPEAPETEEVTVTDEPKDDESEVEDDVAAKKRHNDEMAKQRIASQNRKTRQDVLKQVDENYAPKSEEEFVAEGLSAAEAKIEALRQEMQFRDTRNYIADLNTGLKNDAEIVIRDHPIYDESSPDYDPEFTKEVEEAYKIASRLQVDENGVVLNAEVPLGDFYSRMAKIRERGNVRGQVDGQKDALKMLSRTEPVGSTNTKSTEKSAADMSIQEMEEKYGIVRR